MSLTLFYTSLPDLLAGAAVSLCIAASAAVCGMCGALVLSLMTESHLMLLRGMAHGYVVLLRGTPMLLQLTLIFFALPQVGLSVSAVASAIIAIGCNSAAYMAGILKSGMRSVPVEQVQMAKTLGLGPTATFFHVRWPHIWRSVLPAMTNEWTTLIKDSSLASIIGVHELSKVAALIRGRTYDAWTSLLGAGLLYLVMTWACSKVCQQVQQRGEVPCSL